MKKLLVASLGLAFAQASLANGDLQQLQDLFDAGKSAEAYAYGSGIQAQYEGEAAFDYYFGTAAIDAGDASQGVFALERVLIGDPSNNAARLELARGYFQLDEMARSRQEFEAVLANQPPPAVKAKIEQYLNAIRLRESRYKTTSQLTLRLGFGSDSNVNAGPSDPQFTLPGLDAIGTLGNSSLEQDSAVSELEAGVNVNIPITARFSGSLGTQLLLLSNTDASNFNAQSLTMNGGLKYRLGQHAFRLQAFNQSYVLDSDYYRNTSGLSAQYQYHLSQNKQLQLFAQNTQSDYVDNPNQDTHLLLWGAGYAQQLNMRFAPLLTASLYMGEEQPEKENVTNRGLLGRDIVGANLAGQINLSSKSSLRAALGYQSSEAPEVYLVSTAKKKDDFNSLALTFTQLLSRHWKIDASVTSSSNSSNIDISDYDRTRFMVNLSYGK